MASRSMLFVLVIASLFISITFAEIRLYNINSVNFNLFGGKLLFLDSFKFTNKGRIEINVSEIYLSNPNLNFSNFGFSLIPVLRFDKSITVYSFDKLTNHSKSIDIVLGEEEDNMLIDSFWGYYLYFLNNLSSNAAADLQFSMIVRISMYNLEFDSNIGQWTKKNYLSANEILLPKLRFGFILIYICFILISLWKFHVYYIKLKKQRNHLFRIQVAIRVVLIIKVLSLLSDLVRNIYIKHFGYSQGFFVTILAYGAVLLSEVPFATLMTLITCGWSYLKPSLNFKQKIIVMAVIIFHIVMHVDALKYVQIRPNCESCHLCLTYWWCSRCFFDIVVLVYCAHSSYYFLRESGDAEGKALPTLVKIKRLRKFFYVCFTFHYVRFIYTIVQSLLTIWTIVLFGEAITFGLYVFVEYMFWSDLPSLKLRIDDDLEYAAAEDLDRQDILLF